MTELKSWKAALAACLFCVVATVTSPGQDGASYRVLHSFDYTDGSAPQAALFQATDGNLYGTTFGGGTGFGTIFKITPNGTFTTLYDFCSRANCTDGDSTYAGLVQGSNGDLYGVTTNGGTGSGGTVFKMTPGRTLTTLYDFCSQTGCKDGSTPTASLIEAIDGNFYGTTNSGGNNSAGGTVFKITPDGKLTTLYSFCSQTGCTDGNEPFVPLVEATDGNFYGTTSFGGTNGQGTIFKITPSGTLKTLYSLPEERSQLCWPRRGWSSQSQAVRHGQRPRVDGTSIPETPFSADTMGRVLTFACSTKPGLSECGSPGAPRRALP